MYHHHHQWGGSFYPSYGGGVDNEVNGGDAILHSRPDALLANGGGAFLPSSLPPSSYMQGQSLPLQPHSSQLEEQSTSRVAVRYSAEERREHIDKYRSKRNQRNFQKKITYACRKTLADSRPRVKGRFERNAGDYTDADATADHVVQAAEATHQPLSPAAIEVPTADSPPEWWTPAVQELPTGINLEDLCAADDDILAAYLGVSSISIQDHQYSCQP